MTITPSFASNPSISTRIWFNVCSLSSFPPPVPVPRFRPTASISSINITQGVFFFACSNKSLTREAPTPTYISTKSEPETDKNFTSASPATARASKVFPVPGGPKSKVPFGILAPSSVYFLGFFRKSTTSLSSSFSSSAPATSEKSIFFLLSVKFLVLALPKPICRPGSPIEVILLKNIHPIKHKIKIGRITREKEFINQEVSAGFTRL